MNARQISGMVYAVDRASLEIASATKPSERREILRALADAAFALGAMQGMDDALVRMAQDSSNERGRQA